MRLARSSAAAPDDTVLRFLGLDLSRGEALLWFAIFWAVLHHLDHVLRADHSGWPFNPNVSPFTFSFLAYVLLLTAFMTARWPWFRVALTAIVFVFIQVAHIFLEPPADQYNTWTQGSSLSTPGAIPGSNLVGIESPILGYLSVVLSVLMSLSLLAALVEFTREALRARRSRGAVAGGQGT